MAFMTQFLLAVLADFQSAVNNFAERLGPCNDWRFRLFHFDIFVLELFIGEFVALVAI